MIYHDYVKPFNSGDVYRFWMELPEGIVPNS